MLGVPGIKIGHAVNNSGTSGCTVFLCPNDCVASVDVRGLGPGSREAALLAVDKHVDVVHAVLLTGGSAFGLAAADGVMRYLKEQNIGYAMPFGPIPIVPAAVIYDLLFGKGEDLPNADLGYQACLNASEQNAAQGNVGVGTGATVGKWARFLYFMKGGFGLASLTIGDLVVGAGVAVNALGDVVSQDGTTLAGARTQEGGWMADNYPLRHLPSSPDAHQGTNTTLAVIATNARLTKVQANRLAQRGHDGLAVAIRPVHTSRDGDTVYGLATGQLEADYDLVANMAVEVVAEAIRNAVRFAQTLDYIPGLA